MGLETTPSTLVTLTRRQPVAPWLAVLVALLPCTYLRHTSACGISFASEKVGKGAGGSCRGDLSFAACLALLACVSVLNYLVRVGVCVCLG